MGISDLTWRKSSYSGSGGGNCVEVAQLPTPAVAVRDSKNPDGPRLVFPASEWQAFVAGVKVGEFDLSLSAASRVLGCSGSARVAGTRWFYAGARLAA
jgi:hypothetical protein